MLMPQMLIHFQLTVMAPKSICKGKGKATASAKIPTSVINWRLSLDRDHIKGFISEHIRGLIQIYSVWGVKDEWTWYLFDNIIFLDLVTSRYFSQFQLLWLHHWSRSSPFRSWWAAFHSNMGQMFDQMLHHMNDWMWHNPRAFRVQVDRPNPQTTSLGKVDRTSEHFSWHGSC